jgi:hypothetical protein
MRTNISVDEAVAKTLSDEATRENKSQYALANEILESALKMCAEGGSPKEIYPSWRFLRLSKEIDTVPLPGSLMEKMIRKLYASERDWLLQSWFDEGKRVGAYLRMLSDRIDELSGVVGEFQNFLPVKRIEFGKIEEAGKSGIFVRAIGAGLSTESTTCAERFISGIVSSYSLRVTNSRVSEGIIEIRAVPETIAAARS